MFPLLFALLAHSDSWLNMRLFINIYHYHYSLYNHERNCSREKESKVILISTVSLKHHKRIPAVIGWLKYMYRAHCDLDDVYRQSWQGWTGRDVSEINKNYLFIM